MSGCGKTSDLYKKQRKEARDNLSLLNSARRTHKTSKLDIWKPKKTNVRRDPPIRSETYLEELENQKPDPSVFY